MSATTSTYQIVSCKTRDSFTGDLEDAIAKAKEIAEEYQPAYGIRVDLDGETVWDSEQAECDECDAQEIAERALANRDGSLSWLDAGYASALDAARALVGSSHDAVTERAAQIVAEHIA